MLIYQRLSLFKHTQIGNQPGARLDTATRWVKKETTKHHISPTHSENHHAQVSIDQIPHGDVVTRTTSKKKKRDRIISDPRALSWAEVFDGLTNKNDTFYGD